jgi:hypothetical protein
MSRRTAIGLIAGSVPAASIAQGAPGAAQDNAIPLSWLDGTPPPLASGISWGVPWPPGTVAQERSFTLTCGEKRLPLQSWTLAYWPDGSIKWTGFATVAAADTAGPLRLAPGGSEPLAGVLAVSVRQSADAVDIDTGPLQARIPKTGAALIDSMTVDGRVVARAASLVCIRQAGPGEETEQSPPREKFGSLIRKVAVEQSGPVRAVVKVDGVHRAEKGSREWLPFQVRFYFFAGQTAVRLVHTFVFDGDEREDFIRGLGLSFTVPMREQLHNRHVRFSGEGSGLWGEPVLLVQRGLEADQMAGRRLPNREALDPPIQALMDDWVVWDSFKLVQSSADGFAIQKRTGPKSCWLDAAWGKRASGLVFAGDVSGGLGVGVKNFWQSHPASLEVRNASTEAAELRVWLWSPEAPAMDLRHYDTKPHHLPANYADEQPGFSTPHGVARSSELMLFPSAATPARADTARQAQLVRQPPLLACAPEHLHAAGVFGVWSLPDRSTPFKRNVEDRLERALALYRNEIEQRHWYGFWNYGDVMHSYDPQRHSWRYDTGGYAWDNTELASDMWMWYSYVRTGRADVFRMAEAMCRHTSEVDVYHLGRFARLGSRHNVRHWGCGAKELRISQAASRRFYYYLTTDERTGDIMREVVDADYALLEFDPMRLASPPKPEDRKYPARIRGGPDWFAAAGNWMTEWERTGNTKYRDKIVAGLDCISKFPYGLLSGPSCLFGYDPRTGMLYTLSADPFGTYNLTTIQGGAQVVFELNQLIDHPAWQKTWLQYCRLERAPKEVVAKDMTTGTEGGDGAYAGSGRLAAYAYKHTGNAAFFQVAVRALTGGGVRPPAAYTTRRVEGPDVPNPVDEAPGVSTNGASQSSLTAIEVLELCADRLPEGLSE